jgi:hypothetical protein
VVGIVPSWKMSVKFNLVSKGRETHMCYIIIQDRALLIIDLKLIVNSREVSSQRLYYCMGLCYLTITFTACLRGK